MKLVRIVTYTFKPSQNKWKFTNFNDGVVNLNTFSTTKEKKENSDTLLAIAEIKLKEKPKINDDGSLEVPENPRKMLERRIEDIANIISVSENCERRISSVHPYVAFKPESKKEREWLQSTKGIHYEIKSIPSFGFSLQKEFMENEFLSDRLDGVAILAEAISCTHLTGKLHEFMRFFERSFTTSSSSLVEPLSKFLSASRMKVKKKDVVKWIKDLRHPATHADKKDHFVLEADVRPYIYIIEQAAFDVLFNKKIWRNTSTKRRKAYQPIAGVDKKGVGFVIKGSKGLAIKSQMLDHYSVFPINLSGSLTTIPEELWFKQFIDKKRIKKK